MILIHFLLIKSVFIKTLLLLLQKLLEVICGAYHILDLLWDSVLFMVFMISKDLHWDLKEEERRENYK